MAVRVLMPKGSDTMTEGKVLKWLKREGETVSSGDAIVEIETDKVDMEVETTGEGVLRQIIVKEGQSVPVGQLLGIVGTANEDISSLVKSAPAAPAQASKKVDAPPVAPAVPPAPPVLPAPAAHPVPPPTSGPVAVGGRVLASPLARRIAQEKGLDLNRVSGSGPGGRIVRQDVDRAAATGLPSGTGVPPATGTHVPPPARPAYMPGGPEFQDEPLSSMRKIIATRLT